MKEPVDHILRPRLPWRDPNAPAVTECGYDASKVKALTRQEFAQRYRDLGQQRMAMLTCMTCSDTARRWGTWDDDPRVGLQREIEWERGGYWGRGRDDRGHLVRDELYAIAALIAGHKEEFEAILAEMKQRREWNEKKARLQQQKKSRRPVQGSIL